MKTTKLTNQKVISQKVIDLKTNILVRIYKTEDNDHFGFQFVKYHFNEEIDPFNHSKLNWIYGYFKCFEEAEANALELFSQYYVR